MSTHPRLESRVSALERRQLNLETRVEEVNEDTIASLERLSDDIAGSFKQVSEYFGKVEERLDKIEATMVTKEDMAAMENRMLDALKQILTMINPQ